MYKILFLILIDLCNVSKHVGEKDYSWKILFIIKEYVLL